MAFEANYVGNSLDDCSFKESSIKYLYTLGIFLQPLCVSISLESLSIFEVFLLLSKAQRGAGQKKERSCDHRVSSRINCSMAIQPGSELWSPGALAKLLGRSPGGTRAKREVAKAFSWSQVLGAGSIQSGMWDGDVVTREI